MDSRFAKSLVYPQMETHQSVLLNTAPSPEDYPEEGYIYQWESVVNGETCINVRYHDGTQRSYALNAPDVVENRIANPVVADFEFEASDVSDSMLVIDNTRSIADIAFYDNPEKSTRTIVNLPVTMSNETTTISFDEIDPDDYQYGGLVRFSQGVVVLYDEDSIYEIPSASGYQQIDANLGYTQIINHVDGTLFINSENILNCPEYKLIKVIVSNTSQWLVQINGETAMTEKFLVGFMNYGGVVKQVGNIVEIK